MDCTSPELSDNAAFMQAFTDRLIARRIPYSGCFELTRRCNLRCIHCYCGDRAPTASRPARTKELSKAAVCDYLSQVADAGCLFLLLTGGEPMVRPDFPEIYRHAKDCGLLISVFTNGTSITDPIAGLFRELPPHSVEVSVYGASAATYELVTGDPDAYRRCLEGIARLQAIGVRVRLKTMLMTGNRDEFLEIRELARSLGLEFRFDSGVTGRVSGDTGPTAFRVSPQDVADFEFADPNTARGWKDWTERHSAPPEYTRLYNCGAGINTFHIDADGWLRPCPSHAALGWDLAQTGFSRAWSLMAETLAGLRAPEGLACNRCPDRALCSWCPAFAELEGQSEMKPIPFLCEVAGARRKKLSGEKA